MIFTTPQFVVFFLLFFWAYAVAPRRARKVILLAASYLFYGSWNAKFLFLIMGSTLLDFYVGQRLVGTDDARERKRWVTVSVAGNLGALGFFKYYDFFVESAVLGLASVGLDVEPPLLEVLLPVGISFYTFQTMSYTIDIYRGRLAPTRSLVDFAIFVAFFPQLVAGPIERAVNLLPQIATLGRDKRWAPDLSGFGLIALGCFKKAVIADNVADLVQVAYADPAGVYGPALWIGTYAFAIQIYCDFSGYSDIAIGLARLLGLDLMENFESPYAAAGPSEFWRRWHISLSSWLRDYLYIPLGGNRGGWFYVRRNLMLTMLLGGLWHGAAWNFVLWGAFHGTLLILFRARWLRRLSEGEVPFPVVVLRRILFFHITCLGWALFRAESLADCATIVGRLVSPWTWDMTGFWAGVAASGEGRYLALTGAAMFALVLVQNLWPVGSKRVVGTLWKAPPAVRFVVCTALLYACVLFAPEKPPPFIYFQF